MFTVGSFDIPEIWGLNILTVTVAYLAIVILAAIFDRVTKKGILRSWPRHWLAFPLATVMAVPVYLHFAVESHSMARLLEVVASGERVSTEEARTHLAYMLFIGCLAVMFAYGILNLGKKALPKRLALPPPPVGLALNPPCREDSRKIRSIQVSQHGRLPSKPTGKGSETR